MNFWTISTLFAMLYAQINWLIQTDAVPDKLCGRQLESRFVQVCGVKLWFNDDACCVGSQCMEHEIAKLCPLNLTPLAGLKSALLRRVKRATEITYSNNFPVSVMPSNFSGSGNPYWNPNPGVW